VPACVCYKAGQDRTVPAEGPEVDVTGGADSSGGGVHFYTCLQAQTPFFYRTPTLGLLYGVHTAVHTSHYIHSCTQLY